MSTFGRGATEVQIAKIAQRVRAQINRSLAYRGDSDSTASAVHGDEFVTPTRSRFITITRSCENTMLQVIDYAGERSEVVSKSGSVGEYRECPSWHTWGKCWDRLVEVDRSWVGAAPSPSSWTPVAGLVDPVPRVVPG